MQKTKSAFKVVNENDLEKQVDKAKKVRARIVVAALLLIVSLTLLLATFFPYLANKAVPLYWVNIADTSGLTQGLYDDLLKFLAKGKIQVTPRYFSWITGILGTLALWASSVIFSYRNDKKWFGDVLTTRYWMSFRAFYLSNKPQVVIEKGKATNQKKKTETRVVR